MIRLRPSGADEVLIKRVRDWYEPGPGVFIAPQALFNPALLFTTGVNGTWYDPSDLTTLFRDAAGTTPVTAVEQPVGLMLDKSSRGNHAFNPSGNSANFPVLSARYNLLTKSEQFDDSSVWKLQSGASVGSKIIAPDGTTTADTINLPTASSDYIYQSFTGTTTAHNAAIYVKGTAGQTAYIYCGDGIPSTQNPAISVTFDGTWQLLSGTKTLAASTQYFYFFRKHQNGGADATASTFYVWHPSLAVANDALGQPAYQRVNTSTDYDTVGFKPYLRFNGTNQWLQTNSIDFTYGDKMFVSAGVRILGGGSATKFLLESGSSDSFSTPNTFAVMHGYSSIEQYAFRTHGSGSAVDVLSAAAIPATNAVSGIGDISAPSAIIRLNGAQTASSTASQGTGNYGNYPLYIGARAGSSLWFNGRLYGMVVAGKQASAAEITSTETYINQKTGAY